MLPPDAAVGGDDGSNHNFHMRIYSLDFVFVGLVDEIKEVFWIQSRKFNIFKQKKEMLSGGWQCSNVTLILLDQMITYMSHVDMNKSCTKWHPINTCNQ